MKWRAVRANAFMTDCAVSRNGSCGPDGDGTGRPVGLVYIAVDTAGFSFCKELHLSGDRAKIREQAADAVFQLILDTKEQPRGSVPTRLFFFIDWSAGQAGA